MVDRAELAAAAVVVAPRLLGAVIQSRVGGDAVSIRITEVEAYEGSDDPASHAFRGPTPRTEVMFGEAGHLYVYFTYGMHWCANVVCGVDGAASAVLLRAGEVVEGVAVASARRPAARAPRDLARGPARLASCLGLVGGDSGADLCDSTATAAVARRSPVTLLSLGEEPVFLTGPRVGISVAVDRPWRFWLPDDPTVSAFRPGKARAAQRHRAD
ncbi:DNA-3-methyladenine glycosylase [Jatrophihabitans sp. GAS493]|uniref:DNA-3-methyladenine glycosylase n=1 Tax=Jatrophihabitans sp. GAS493 TaxID=1907575 RepID=UPI000BB79F03|nr:DNA-3-methyladenine glycosylase [Jatrophihabitans sp. GAS493]SOD73784.1 DNA-3-methyladenine glycosylase [Jatrophihabitans sp. GAS493]